MSRSPFDPDMNGWNGRENPSGDTGPEGELPPDMADAGAETDDQKETDVEPNAYPGELSRSKDTDPDEWHH